MCGRFTVTTKKEILEERFDAEFEEDFSPRYNAAPSQRLPVILENDPHKIKLLKWGIHPDWLEKTKFKRDGIINVRAETLLDKKIFNKDFEDRRCLVLADGFYEWKKNPAGAKTPYRIILQSGKPFAMAGLWERNWDKQGNEFDSFTIVTTSANQEMSAIHSRMPVLLEADQEKIWLSKHFDREKLAIIFQPFLSRQLEAYPVSSRVNRASIDVPDLIKPI